MLILVEILKSNINMHSQVRKMIIITLTIAFLPIIINSFSPVITPTSRILSSSSSQIQKYSSQQLNMVASARQLKLSSKIKKSSTKKPKPAIDKFDYTTYENKFATYTTWWVKSSISRSITEYDDLVRVPENVLQDI